jgi:hypothetical protein
MDVFSIFIFSSMYERYPLDLRSAALGPLGEQLEVVGYISRYSYHHHPSNLLAISLTYAFYGPSAEEILNTVIGPGEPHPKQEYVASI